jgi:hypothetical protein
MMLKVETLICQKRRKLCDGSGHEEFLGLAIKFPGAISLYGIKFQRSGDQKFVFVVYASKDIFLAS